MTGIREVQKEGGPPDTDVCSRPDNQTLATCRCIDKAGGLDAYILNTPDEKLGSDVGADLRREMLAAKMVPPPRRTPAAARQPAQAGGKEHLAQQPPEQAPG